jgi:hypothetical protein
VAIHDDSRTRQLPDVANGLEYDAGNHGRSVTRPRYLPK